MNKKTVLFSWLLLLPTLGLTQVSLDRQVIGSSGSFSSSGGVELSATVGEAVIQTASSGTITLTQGFQQPDGAGSVSRQEALPSFLHYTLSPNPAHDQLQLDLEADRNLRVHLRLFDLQGKEIPLPTSSLPVMPTASHTLPISTLAEGFYLLALFDDQGNRLATLRWQKW